MILFAKDWAKYPTAFPDLETKNRSFVRLAALYRSMGIKNHTFLLALVNPRLKGVDPHSPNLTQEQMLMIALECKVNPWYFFREVLRAPAIGGGDPTEVEANRGNIALWWSFFNHIMIILIQIRQTGKSFSTDSLMALLMLILCQNTKINLMTKDDILRRKNVERIKDIMADLPRYLQLKGKDDVNNGEEITIRALGNTYTTHVPQASAKRALNMGRGLTSPIFHIDEGPFQPNISLALPAALAATGAAIDKAKKVGAPYGTILTTTAGKKDDKDGRYIFNLLSECADWTEKFFDAKDEVELERLVRMSSRGGRFAVNATFNHRQLGKTDEWLRQKLEESLQTGDDANRDYFNMWTSGSQTNPLPTAVLEAITRSVKTDEYTDISTHGYITHWFIKEEEIASRMAEGRFVLGMDTSEASGGDDISLVLTDVTNLEVVAAGTFNETNLIVFAEWVCSVLVKYSNITAIIERRSTGAMLLDYLLYMLPQHGEDPFRRLYNTVVQKFDEEPEAYKEIKLPMNRRDSNIYVRYKRSFGFATSGSGATSRTELYSTTLQLGAKRGQDRVHYKGLIEQINGLITRNGRIDHEQGEHDDLVIGWLLCMWILFHGKNLSHYDIDIRQVMSAVGPTRIETVQERAQKMEQAEIRQKIVDLYEQLTKEEDDWVSIRLEQQLRMLDKKIILEQGEHYSLDGLLEDVKDRKRSRRKEAMHQRYNGMATGSSSYQIAPHHAQQGTFSDRPMTMRDYR